MPILLAYISRSGSTLLARHLDAVPGVGVTYEANLPDGIFRPELVIDRAADVDAALETLFADAKLRAWGLARDDLRERLLRRSFPLRFAGVLDEILAVAFADRDVRHPILKHESCIWRLDATRRLHPDAHVVFIERDPRAIFGSQRTALGSKTGVPISASPFVVALTYVRAIEQVTRHAGEPWFHVVRYEDLVDDPPRTLRTLLDALGIDAPVADTSGPASDYAARIPAAQRHLHPNVDGPPKPRRVSAWRDELTPAEIDVIQWVAGRAMERRGYEPVASGLSWPSRLAARVWSLRRAVRPIARAAARMARLARAEKRAAA